MAVTYFVPCSANFQSFVKDRTAPRYWKVLIDINGDDLLEDVTSLVAGNQISGGGKMGGQNGEAISNQYKVQLRNQGGGFREGDLAGAACAIEAKVGTAEYIRIFTGFVDFQGCTRDVTYNSDDLLTIEMIDFTKHTAINRKTDKKVLVNHKICDPGDTGNSLFHKLTSMLGLSPAELETGEPINHTKAYLPYDGNNSVWKELQELAAQYLALLTFRYDGKLRFRSRFEEDWEEPGPEWTFDETNVHKFSGRGGTITANKIKTEFDEHQVLNMRCIHKNVEDYNVVTGQILIVVPAGSYWPGPGAADIARLSYKEPSGGEEYPIGINIQTPSIGATGSGSDIECSGGILEMESFNGTSGNDPGKTNQNPDSSELILVNNTAGPITITKFELRGQPIRINKKIIVEDKDTNIVNEWEFQEKTIPGRYASGEAQAHETTQWWLEYGKVKRKSYDIETDWLPQVQEGAKVTLSLPSLSINMIGVITSFTHPPAKGPMSKQTTKLTIREDYSFSPSGTPSVVVKNMGQTGAETADQVQHQLTGLEDEIDNRPTYQEVQEGYTQGGGTTTPEQPLILVCEPVATKAMMLVVDKQLNLTNFKQYEWQVSEDQAAWYSLKFDGSDWKDTPGGLTPVDVEFLTHSNIPHTGDPEDPRGRQLYYRVRRVTRVGLYSPWSQVSQGTTKTVNPGDLAVNSVYVNNLVAGIVNAMVAQLNSYLEVGGDGFIGKTYGSTSGYQECGLSNKDRTKDTGLEVSHTYYFKVTVDGGPESEYLLTTGPDTTFAGLLNLLNGVVVGCLFDITKGDLRCSSVSPGDDSSIGLAPGTSGDDLFFYLTGFTAFEPAVPGQDNPVAWGATRSRVFEDSWIIEFWNGSEWIMIMQGGGRYNNELFPYLQARGLVAPEAQSTVDGLDFGEMIPSSGNPRLFKFDGSYEDQKGADPWSTKLYLEFISQDRKFGTHCLECQSDFGVLEDNAAQGITWDAPFVIDFWHYIASFDESGKTFFKLGTGGSEDIHHHNTTGSIAADTDPLSFHSCKLSENKILCAFKTVNTGLEIKVGTIASEGFITWGSSVTVTASSSQPFFVTPLDENKIILSYGRDVDGDIHAFCKIGIVSGDSVSFGDEQRIQDSYSSGAALISRLDNTHVVVSFSLSAMDQVCKVGSITGTTVSFGAEYSWSSGQDAGFDIAGVSGSRFIILFQQYTSNYLRIRVGDITNENEITFGTALTASGTRGIDLARAVRLDQDSFALMYKEITTNDLYVRRGSFSGNSPVFNSETLLANSIDTASLAYCGKSENEESHQLVFNLVSAGLGGGVLQSGTITDGGTWSLFTASPVYDADVSGVNVIGRNRFMFVSLWSDNLAATTTLESRSAGKAGHKLCQWEKGKNYYTGEREISFLFVCSDETAGELVCVRHIFSEASPGWFHFSINFDQSNKLLYCTLNALSANIDLTTYTPGADPLALSWYLLMEDKLDDLLVLPSTYGVTYQTSIDHYKNNVRWSIEFDFRRDIIISPGEGGKVHFPGTTTGKFYAVYAP